MAAAATKQTRSQAGDRTAGDQGQASGGEGSEGLKVLHEQIKALTEGVVAISKSVETIGQMSMKNQEGLGSLTASLHTLIKEGIPKQPGDVPAATKPLDELDLETIDRKGLIKVIEERSSANLKAELKSALDPVVESIKGLGVSTQGLGIKTMLAELQGKYKDFNEWVPEITAVLKETNNSVTPEQAYVLARSVNEKKVEEMAEKYKDTTDGSPDAGDGGLPGKGILTLFGTNLPATVEDRNMSLEEASEKGLSDALGESGSDPLAAILSGSSS